MYVRELRLVYESRPDLPTIDRILRIPNEAAAYVTPILENEPAEVFLVICLSAKHGVLGFRIVARGAVDCVHVSPAEVFKVVLLSNAPAFVVAHNHPSGDATPSPDDCAITQRLVAGASLLGLDLLDHLIVGDKRFYSFKEGGRL
jgi:DNA repair protein RadC